MTQEEKFVVNPLTKYFLDHKRSGANWIIKDRPAYGTAATGWDLQVERKNQVLLIEAKYIRGAFAASLAGLTIAPLSHRPERMKQKKLYRSWSAVICWAIGVGYPKVKKYQLRDVHQILFDYFSRNLPFWKYYCKTLHVKYIFFVHDGRVAKVSFDGILAAASLYKTKTGGNNINTRRIIAGRLMNKLLKFS